MSRFDPEVFCASIEKYKVTVAGVVPPILVTLLHHPAAEKYSLHSLVYLSSGAAPLAPELVNRVKAKFSKLGNNEIVITQG
jgi:4-coumarate--CoA ligase